jgi:hypothetical protein
MLHRPSVAESVAEAWAVITTTDPFDDSDEESEHALLDYGIHSLSYLVAYFSYILKVVVSAFCSACLVQTIPPIVEEWKAEFSKINTTRGINHPNQFEVCRSYSACPADHVMKNYFINGKYVCIGCI